MQAFFALILDQARLKFWPELALERVDPAIMPMSSF
jgi:hypothetical protein